MSNSLRLTGSSSNIFAEKTVFIYQLFVLEFLLTGSFECPDLYQLCFLIITIKEACILKNKRLFLPEWES